MAHLLYIHGFLSSPESLKATQLRDWLRQHRPDIRYHCPFLTPYPEETRATLETLVKEHAPEPVYLVGSSLGGFWATWLAEKYDLRAVLINPAVELRFLERSDYIGVPLKNYYTDDSYLLTERHAAQFERVMIDAVQRPHNYWLLLQTGDEVLDYRLAVEKYAGDHHVIEEGGDHGFQNFNVRIPDIIRFLEMREHARDSNKSEVNHD